MPDDEEFEELYHRFMNDFSREKFYENQLISAMITSRYTILRVVEKFESFFLDKAVSQWVDYIEHKTIKERNMTPRHIKERKLIVRKLYRVAKCNRKLMRVLDMVLLCVKRHNDALDKYFYS